MLKRYLFLIIITLAFNLCNAQGTIQVKRKITNNVTEVFTVLKNDINYRQGLYQALYKKKTPVASGMYDKDKKVSLWKFTDPKGVILQTYDYTRDKVFYEAPEDTTSRLRYFVDKDLKPGDVVTKPIKIGGRYFGYLPYLSLFTLPEGYKEVDRSFVSAVVILLISPGGRLADYKVNLINSISGQPFKTVNMNIKLPDPADMIFTPATLNGEAIACRITIQCVVDSRGHLDFE
jgi:hypothetical protein